MNNLLGLQRHYHKENGRIVPKDDAKVQHSCKTTKYFEQNPHFGIIIVGIEQGLQLESCTFAKITLLKRYIRHRNNDRQLIAYNCPSSHPE